MNQNFEFLGCEDDGVAVFKCRRCGKKLLGAKAVEEHECPPDEPEEAEKIKQLEVA
jgi:hypothetical protein